MMITQSLILSQWDSDSDSDRSTNLGQLPYREHRHVVLELHEHVSIVGHVLEHALRALLVADQNTDRVSGLDGRQVDLVDTGPAVASGNVDVDGPVVGDTRHLPSGSVLQLDEKSDPVEVGAVVRRHADVHRGVAQFDVCRTGSKAGMCRR